MGYSEHFIEEIELFRQSNNEDRIQKAIDNFSSANEHLYYLYPDYKKKQIHLFEFKDKIRQRGITEVIVEYLGVK